jgi:benzoate-CoA ligase
MPEVEVPEWFNAASYFVDRNLAEGRSDNVAILFQDQELTYRQVAENANRTGHALRELGLQMEQRVMLLLLDCPQLVYCFFGAMKIGAVPVPVNTLLKAGDYRYLLNDSRARVLVVSQELYATVEPILAELEYLRQVVVVGRWRAALVRRSGCRPAPRTGRDTYLQGRRRLLAVHLRHHGYAARRGSPAPRHGALLELYARGILDIAESDRTYSVAVVFAYGLGNALYCPFGIGATTILLPGRPQPDAVFEVVNRYRPRSSSPCPPPMPDAPCRRTGTLIDMAPFVSRSPPASRSRPASISAG